MKLKYCILSLPIFLITFSVLSQDFSDGYYYNEETFSYIYVDANNYFLYTPDPSFSGIRLYKYVKKDQNLILSHPPESIINTTVIEEIIEDKSYYNKILFSVEDFTGYFFSDTIMCKLSYKSSQNSIISIDVFINQVNGYYMLDLEKYPFSKASLELDWFLEKIYLMDRIDKASIKISKGVGKKYLIHLAPQIHTPKTPQRIKLNTRDNEIQIRYPFKLYNNQRRKKKLFIKIDESKVEPDFINIIKTYQTI